MTTAKKLTIEELEQELKTRKDEENAKRDKEKKAYEAKRDKTVKRIMHHTVKINGILTSFKADLENVFNDMKEECDKYGGIRKNSLGGFSLTNSDDSFRVTRCLDKTPVWDERCDKGIDLIKEFLVSKIKTKDKTMYEILMTFLQRNNKGDMNYANIMQLLKHEDKYTDERWVEGFRLLRENYKTSFKKFYYVLSLKNDKGAWEPINLNLASI